jgi:hypothetical protein
VTLISVRAGQTVRYTDVAATVTIASPEAPFHLQVAAASAADMAAGAADAADRRPVRGSLTVNATLPGLQTLAAGGPGRTSARWGLLGDAEVAVTRTPTGVACDLLGLDGGWAESVGEVIDLARFSNHAAATQDAGRPVLLVRGSGAGGQTKIDARLLLKPPGAQGEGGELTLPPATAGADEGLRLEVALRLSRPLADVLRRVHPLLGEARAAADDPDGLVECSVSSLRLPLDRPWAEAQGAARLTFPRLALPAGGETRMAAQLCALAGDPAGSAGVTGTAGPLRLRCGGGAFWYENFQVTLGRTRVSFDGQVGFDGTVHLLAVLPGGGGAGGLGAGRAQVVIGGTAAAPTVRQAE